MKNFNLTKYFKEAARKIPIHETFVSESIFEAGLGEVIVSRRKPNGDILFVMFLLDIYCLGVKNILYNLFTIEKYEEVKSKLFESVKGNFIHKSPNYVFNLIYGAVDYAEEIGFKPHKHFAIIEYILDDVDTIVYEEIEFGYEGKPLYIAGPDDNVGKILRTLNANIGAENYEYISPKDGDFDEDKDDDEYDDDHFGALTSDFYFNIVEEGQNEIRSMIVLDDNPYRLPKGEYGFVERYCTDKTCNCQHVDVLVIEEKSTEPLAIISYGWESKEFYCNWLPSLRTSDPELKNFMGPALKFDNPQSEWAPKALEAFKFLLEDKLYANRIKEHYKKVSKAIGRKL